MTKAFVIFLRLPFEKRTYKIIFFDNKITKGKDVVLPNFEYMITINLWDFLSNMEERHNFPNEIFDLNTARKITEGKSKNLFQRDNEPWSGLKVLGRSFTDQNIFGKIKSIEDNKHSMFSDWEEKLPIGWDLLLMEAYIKEYEKIVSNLGKINLYKNFVTIEMRLLLGFIKSSENGVLIDHEKLEARCIELDTSYYNSIKELEINYNYFVSDFRNVTYEKIKEYINGYDKMDFNDKYIWDSIELYRSINPFLDHIYKEYNIRRDLSELLRMTVGMSDRCRLQYDIMGTVSGRILITRPGIQYLKKTSRDIFKPHDGNSFIYADYSQFEPGILAYLSNDPKLRDAYIKNDLYQNLSNIIGNGCTRAIAKKIFLSYIYGMKIDNIRNNIIKTFGDFAGVSVEKFLNEFPNVTKWKESVIKDSFAKKIASGLTGYIRYFSEDDHKYEIARWAPNHIIQSTASGIFKKALVKYLDEKTGGRILVPMHDAILIEVSSEKFEQEKKVIYRCMQKSFENLCPGINCKIHFDNFSSE